MMIPLYKMYELNYQYIYLYTQAIVFILHAHLHWFALIHRQMLLSWYWCTSLMYCNNKNNLSITWMPLQSQQQLWSFPHLTNYSQQPGLWDVLDDWHYSHQHHRHYHCPFPHASRPPPSLPSPCTCPCSSSSSGCTYVSCSVNSSASPVPPSLLPHAAVLSCLFPPLVLPPLPARSLVSRAHVMDVRTRVARERHWCISAIITPCDLEAMIGWPARWQGHVQVRDMSSSYVSWQMEREGEERTGMTDEQTKC